MARMNWQKMFQKHILDRGYDYYCEGAVESFEIQDGIISAAVYGSEDYEVEIQVEDGMVLSMDCSCPYAGSGNFCKHMAAVLYEWDSEFQDEHQEMLDIQKVVNTSVKDEVVVAVTNADVGRLKTFLVEMLAADEKMFLQFKQYMKMALSPKDLDRYKEQVDTIIDQYTDRHGFINYNEANRLIDELYELLEAHVEMMITNHENISAFELTSYVFVTISQVDMDDSSGCLSVLAAYCNEIWQKLINQSDFETKKAFFKWFVEHLDGSIVDYMESYLENMLMTFFEEPFFIQEKLKLTNQKVHDNEASNSDSGYQQHRAGYWAQQHMGLMEKTHCNASEIKAYAKAHWRLSDVREVYIEHCIKSGNDHEAICVLKESYQMDSAYRGLLLRYSTKLKNLYQKTNNQEAYKAQLWQLVLKDSPAELDYFRELKGLYRHETWLEMREHIFNELPKYANIEPLLIEENLLDRLLTRVLQTDGLYMLGAYEASLIALYPQEILEKYALEVNKMAVHTGGRKHYQQLVSILRHMKTLDGGKEMVDEIVKRWRVAYANRPAMMDELNKRTL